MNAEPPARDIRWDEWRERSACHFADPRLFTNPTTEEIAGIDKLTLRRERDRRTAAAKAVCRRCPVRYECLLDALENNEPGVRGGYTEHERKTQL